MKKTFFGFMVLLVNIVGITFADERIDAATFLYEQEIIDKEPMSVVFEAPIYRREAAVVMKRFAVEQGKKMIQSCTLRQDTLKLIEKNELLEACNVGLFKQATYFYPNQYFTREQLIMVLARFLNNKPTMEKDESYDYLLQKGVIKVDDRTKSTRVAMRSEVYLMLHRLSLQTTTQSTDLFSKVLKIKAYDTDPVMGNFILRGHGSAVLVGTKKIVTNAHVVLGEDNKPLTRFEYCYTEHFTQGPKCVGIAKLLYLDIDADLALLELDTKFPTSITPVVFSTMAPKIGEKVTIYGYPGNGGESITSSQGIIGGYENGSYKIDANIDGGNSGGGGFDDKGNLVGIPTFVVMGYSTLGYMIPASAVQSFLNKQGTITEVNIAPTSNFVSYLSSIQKFYNQKNIITSFFTVTLPDSFRFAGGTNFQTENGSTMPVETMIFSSLNGKTIVAVTVSLINSELNIEAIKNAAIDELKKWYSTVTPTDTPTWSVIQTEGNKVDSSQVSVIYLQKNAGKYLVKTVVFGSNTNLNDLNIAKKLAESIIPINKELRDSTTNNTFAHLGFSTVPGVMTEIYLDENSTMNYEYVMVDSGMPVVNGSVQVWLVSPPTNMSGANMTAVFEKMLEDELYVSENVQKKLVENSKGALLYMLTETGAKNTSYSFVSVVEAPGGKRKIALIDAGYESTIHDANDKKIHEFIDGITITGKLPYATLGGTSYPLR